MNEKGWCSTLGGSFAVIRTVRPVPGRKLYERLSSLSYPPGALSFRFLPRLLARSYISHCGFEIIFMSRRQRLPRSTVCIYPREDRRCPAKAYPPSSFELCNLANLADCESSSRGSLLIETLLVRLCDTVWFFSVFCAAIRAAIACIYSKATECKNSICSYVIWCMFFFKLNLWR